MLETSLEHTLSDIAVGSGVQLAATSRVCVLKLRNITRYSPIHSRLARASKEASEDASRRSCVFLPFASIIVLGFSTSPKPCGYSCERYPEVAESAECRTSAQEYTFERC